MTSERTATVDALTGLARVADLGIDARHPLTAQQISQVSKWRTRVEDLALATTRVEAVRLAVRPSSTQLTGGGPRVLVAA